MNSLAIFGITSAVIVIISGIPYIRSILKGKTKPERASWWIWLVLVCAIFAAQLAAGFTYGVFITGAFVIMNFTIALLSLKHGYGRFRYYDWASLLIAFFGVYLWRVTGQPLVALVILITVDFLGNWLTMAKSWRAPYSENLLTWALGIPAGIFAILAVGDTTDAAKLIYPYYIAIASCLVTYVIYYRRQWRSKRIKLGKSFSK